MSSEDPGHEPTLSLGDPRQAPADELISERDRVAAALFATPIARVEVGRYRVDRKLGEGAMGVVYEGCDEALDRTVALKVIRAQAWDGGDAADRFRREAQALARLSHPNVVTIHEIGEHADQLFIAMELVRGRTLREWMADEKPNWQARVAIFIQAGRGLASAHSAQLVHRDFKPDNCIVGDDGRVRVLDFGLARGLTAEGDVQRSRPSEQVLDATVTASGALVGTPAYMAPEQLRGNAVDAASDQFAFCVALYEALVGVRPFSGNSLFHLEKSIRDDAPLVPEEKTRRTVPRQVLALVRRGLCHDPRGRWPDLAGLLDALERYPTTRRRERWALGASVALCVGFGSAFALFIDKEGPCASVSRLSAPGWHDSGRAALRASITAEGERADEAWETVESAADGWAKRWTAARTHACEEALVSHVTTPNIYDRQAMCLDRQGATFSAYLHQLSVDPLAWKHAPEFAAAFPTIHGCVNPAHVIDIEAPSPALAEQVSEVRTLLDRARALSISGDIGASTAAADAALEASERIDDTRLRAEVDLLRGKLQLKGVTGSAEQSLLAALRGAELARDDFLAAEVAIELVLLTTVNRQLHASARWQTVAFAKLERVEAPPPKFALLEAMSAQLARLQEDPGLAQEHSSRAIELLTQSIGLDDVRALPALTERALTLEMQDDPKPALAAHDDCVASYRKAVGSHPALANALFNRASYRDRLGRTKGAKADYEQAGEILQDLPGEERLLANVRMGLIWLRSMSGELDLADVDEAVAPLQHLAEDDDDRLLAAEWRAAVLLRIGQNESALAEYERILARMERNNDYPAADIAMVQSNAAECELALGRIDAARRRFAASLSALEASLSPEDPRLAYPLAGLGHVELASAKRGLAAAHFQRGLEILDEGWGDTLLVANLNWGLAQALDGKRSLEAADRAAALFGELGPEGEKPGAEVKKWLRTVRSAPQK